VVADGQVNGNRIVDGWRVLGMRTWGSDGH
jgi:hypothetical protein